MEREKRESDIQRGEERREEKELLRKMSEQKVACNEAKPEVRIIGRAVRNTEEQTRKKGEIAGVFSSKFICSL